MQNDWQLCQTQEHIGCKLTHICVFQDCKETSRYVYDSGKCEFNASHDHNGKMNNYIEIEIENFMQYFKDQRLPQIELLLKSQCVNEAKLKYLTKIQDEHFGDQLQQCSSYFAFLLDSLNIKELINLYKDELEQVQLLNDIYQQLTLNGLQSLNQNQLNILIINKWEFIEKEIQYYDSIEQKFYFIGDRQRKIQEFFFKQHLFRYFDQREIIKKQEEFALENQKYKKIKKQIRLLYDYLVFQNHSTKGKFFFYHGYKPINSSFFSKNDRYFALISQNHKINVNNQLKIRKQNTMDVKQKLIINGKVQNIKFDPLFKYCIIQQTKYFYIYFLRKHQKSKLIQKQFFKKIVIDYFLSQKNFIIIHKNFIVIKPINCKEKFNEINSINVSISCYGGERNLIAINGDSSNIQIYDETSKQKQPLINSSVDKQFLHMKFINNDSHLLTQDKNEMKLWKIDLNNFTITQINVIELQSRSQYFINQTELNIIKSTFIQGDQLQIELLDFCHNLYYRFSIQCYFRQRKSMYLTKNYLLVFHKNYGSQLIRRRQITSFERLQYEY